MPNYEKKSDEEIARLVLIDKELIRVLIERYERRLRAYIVKISGVDQDVAADILQDAFIKAYLNLRDFDDQQKFSTWIYRIVHNETISHWRKRRRENISLDATEAEKIVADLDILRDVQNNLDAVCISRVLGELDEKYRSILILKYFEERQYDEIAEILRLPPGTVAIRLRRAKEKFSKLYTKICHK